MPAKNIVLGQKTSAAKVQAAKQLRHHMTPEEDILWQQLRRNQLNGLHFRRQQIIEGFIVDLYCHAAGLIVEVDGPVHDEQVEYDEERDRILAARGLRILRIKNAEIRSNLKNVLARILAACRKVT
jgi:very-short-patch-repair endonuclease